MKTLTVLAMVLLGVQAYGQMTETIIGGKYRFRQTHPLGYVEIDEIQTLDNNLLRTEVWTRFSPNTPGVTQALDRITSQRVSSGSWQDILWQRTEWSTNGVTERECPQYHLSRGFGGNSGVGVGVWKSMDDGRRYLIIGTATYKVSWTRASTACWNGGVQYGNNGVSAFEYSLMPLTQINIKIFGSCTISSLVPATGYPDNREAIVNISTPTDGYYKYLGRGECYYCEGDKACWWWDAPSNPMPSKGERSGSAFVVSWPSPIGSVAEVWRTSDFQSYEMIGTSSESDGFIRFTDTNPPTNHAFYILNHL